MKKICLVVLSILCGGCAMTAREVAIEAATRNVEVATENHSGTGIIIEPNIVLTVCHMIEIRSKIKVNDKEAEVILVIPEADLMMLSVETKAVEPIKFATEYSVLEQVILIGNPLDLYGVINVGRIVKIDDDIIYTDNLAIPGFSGGGVYNLKGELVGVASALKQASIGSSMLMVIPATRLFKEKKEDEVANELPKVWLHPLSLPSQIWRRSLLPLHQLQNHILHLQGRYL